ncbi:MAG: hypothetical protein WHT09_06010 [Thermogutta sp.]
MGPRFFDGMKNNLTFCIIERRLPNTPEYVQGDGGSLEDTPEGIVFRDCDSLTLFLVAGTNYSNDRNKARRGELPIEKLTQQLNSAAGRGLPLSSTSTLPTEAFPADDD